MNENSDEIKDLCKDIIEIKSMMKMLIPSEFTISFIANSTGRTRQAVYDYITRNHRPDIDFWKKNGKIYISSDVALHYMAEKRI